MWYLHLAAWRGSCCGEVGQWAKRRDWSRRKGRTLEDVARKVALVLAAAGSGGRAVGIGVLPLLEELLGLVEQDLARGEGESANHILSRELCRSGSIGVVQCGGVW